MIKWSEVNSKIVPLDSLPQTLLPARTQGRRVVQCHGVFDLLHIGHIHHFQAARRFGEVLVVTLTPDRFVNKGPGRPVFGQELRAQAVAALECVDFVAINHWPTAVEPIGLLRPDFYCKGSEYRRPDNDVTGKISDEEAAVLAAGGQIVFTEEPTQSSSHLLNHFVAPGPGREYLDDFARRHSSKSLISTLNRARDWTVLVTGDSYWTHTARCTSRPGSPSLNPRAQVLSSQAQLSGVPCLAQHLQSFCAQVLQVSQPLARWRRYLGPMGHNLFEAWEAEPAAHSLRLKLENALKEEMVVIVHDRGLGAVDEQTLDWLVANSRFVVLHSEEGCLSSRLAQFSIGSKEEEGTSVVRTELGSVRFSNAQGGFTTLPLECPSQSVVLPAIAALCAAAGQSAEVAAMVGVAAEKLRQDPLDRISLCKYLEVLLK